MPLRGYCIVLWASRRALIDFPLMAWVTLSMALLSCTQGFSSLPDSIAWGIVSGLGLLLKPPFVIFLLGPVLWTLLASRREKKVQKFPDRTRGLCGIGIPCTFGKAPIL